MWRSILLVILCIYYIHSKLIITNFDYQYTREGVIIRCLYNNGLPERSDRLQLFFNNTLIYSYDSKPIVNNQIDGAELDPDKSNSTHLTVKNIKKRINAMFVCKVNSLRTIENTKAERRFIFG